MKKTILLLSLIFAFALFFGCSTNNDGNGNTTTAIVPSAPTSLNGQVISSSQINLSWTDNSTNETGFKIERKTGTGIYALVGSVSENIQTFNDTGLSASTVYTYRVCSNNTIGNSLAYSNEVTRQTNNIGLPLLTTNIPNTITSSSAWSGGTISSDGGSTITAKGVVWSTSSNPTIALPTKTNNGIGIENFTSSILGLSANTTYHVKAYASNSVGTTYGTELSFSTASFSNTSITDIDGNVYQLVTICGQVWTKSNLDVSHYRNGDIIPQVTDGPQWHSLTTGAWCYYNNDPANGAIYGKLYNWYAVNDPRGLAPAGYHIPTKTEWFSIFSCLGGTYAAADAMKEAGTAHWLSPTTSTNSSGFTGLPGGYRDTSFTTINSYGWWWSSSDQNNIDAPYFVLWTSSYAYNGYNTKLRGYSVRCIKD